MADRLHLTDAVQLDLPGGPLHVPAGMVACFRCGELSRRAATLGYCASCSSDIARERMWAEMGISDEDLSRPDEGDPVG